MSVLKRCENQLILQNRSRRTRDSYLRCTRQFVDWLGDTPIADVDEERVRHYLVRLVSSATSARRTSSCTSRR